ncbi:hypothetical protein LOK49_LG07G03633 [Camellia lanceoleosa]|uniref:Uncharacterized protein n=1 Tax=Camellia lanceoleosa TaxID=1840588 RepID=A0ACC0H1C8_9ERIC|nr:hypothetical protein LOK49_LG07G03633 [Camellia lanceoleosa]
MRELPYKETQLDPERSVDVSHTKERSISPRYLIMGERRRKAENPGLATSGCKSGAALHLNESDEINGRESPTLSLDCHPFHFQPPSPTDDPYPHPQPPLPSPTPAFPSSDHTPLFPSSSATLTAPDPPTGGLGLQEHYEGEGEGCRAAGEHKGRPREGCNAWEGIQGEKGRAAVGWPVVGRGQMQRSGGGGDQKWW